MQKTIQIQKVGALLGAGDRRPLGPSRLTGIGDEPLPVIEYVRIVSKRLEG
jgi:hypothetical protein